MEAYAGIGSRDTPEDILRLMAVVAAKREDDGFILRSGGADGADTAFESGVVSSDMKEIYLPWKGFNGRGTEVSDIFLYSNSTDIFWKNPAE